MRSRGFVQRYECRSSAVFGQDLGVEETGECFGRKSWRVGTLDIRPSEEEPVECPEADLT